MPFLRVIPASIADKVDDLEDDKTDKNTLSATGDIYYASAPGQPTRLPIGVNGQVLASTGSTPAWVDSSGGSNEDAIWEAGGVTHTVDSLPSGTVMDDGTLVNGTVTEDGAQERWISSPGDVPASFKVVPGLALNDSVEIGVHAAIGDLYQGAPQMYSVPLQLLFGEDYVEAQTYVGVNPGPGAKPSFRKSLYSYRTPDEVYVDEGIQVQVSGGFNQQIDSHHYAYAEDGFWEVALTLEGIRLQVINYGVNATNEHQQGATLRIQGNTAFEGYRDFQFQGYSDTNPPPRPPDGFVREYVRYNETLSKYQVMHRYQSGDDVVVSTQN